jgi:hypothetical protein
MKRRYQSRQPNPEGVKNLAWAFGFVGIVLWILGWFK